MKTVGTKLLFILAAVIVLSLLFWGTMLLYGYWADDVSPQPADESSVPAPQTY